MRGELDAFPAAWESLAKNLIHRCHCKDAVKNAEGKVEWSPVGKGLIDWAAQFRELREAGYREAVSLETQWESGGSPGTSTRICWDGMKQALQQAS